jgi:hypothetical protein
MRWSDWSPEAGYTRLPALYDAICEGVARKISWQRSGDQHHVTAGDGPLPAGGVSLHLIALGELQEEQLHFRARFLAREGQESVGLAAVIMGRHLHGSRDAALLREMFFKLANDFSQMADKLITTC